MSLPYLQQPLTQSIIDRTYKSINEWLQHWMEEPSICNCGSPMTTYQTYDQPPSRLAFSLNTTRVSISKTICIKGSNGKFTVLPLRGIIYSGGFHFTSCIITPGKEVWYHDGMVTRRNYIKGCTSKYGKYGNMLFSNEK